MRIALFSDSYHPYVSGVVKSVEVLARELGRLGHTPVILAPAYPGFTEEPGVLRYPSLPAPTYATFRLAVPFSPHVSRALRRISPHIIHVHSPFLMGLAGARWARVLNVPLVFTYHTLYKQYVHYFPFFPGAVRAAAASYLRWFCNRCNQIIAPSQGVRQMLQDDGVTTPVAVVPTGVDAEAGFEVDGGWLRERVFVPSGRQVLLFVGRLGREKNLPFLLRCVKRLNASEPPGYHLVIVAGGPEEEALKSLAHEMGIEGEVTFAGRWPHEEVLRAYCGADLFVFASQTETQGLVVLEAMNAGLPVVAVKAIGVEDVVEDGVSGFLTPPRIDEFCERVKQVTKDPELRRRLSHGASERAKQFTSIGQAALVAELYKRLRRSDAPNTTGNGVLS